MQNNFDLKKFLIENKLTPQSQKTEALDKYGKPKSPLPEEEMNEDYFYEGEEEAEKQYADLLKQADQAEMQRGGDPGAADYMLKAIYDEINKLKAQFPNLGK
jgi:hypothetical protein